MTRRFLQRGSALEKAIGFARAVRIGEIIAVSGTAPIGPEGETLHPGDVYRQTLACLRHSAQALDDLGASAEDVIRTRILLTDITRWEDAARAHAEIFAGVKPACTFCEVSRFIRADWLVETEVDAVCAN